MLRRFLTGGFFLVLGLHLLFGVPGLLIARFPRAQKLADCTSASFTTDLRVTTGPPYHLLIALPTVGTNGVSFSGEVAISRDSRQVATLSVGSEDLYPSTWLKGQNGQILTWSQANRAKLNTAIVRGQTHTFEFKFREAPPKGSAIWLSSLARVTNFPWFWMTEAGFAVAGVSLLIWRKQSMAAQRRN